MSSSAYSSSSRGSLATVAVVAGIGTDWTSPTCERTNEGGRNGFDNPDVEPNGFVTSCRDSARTIVDNSINILPSLGAYDTLGFFVRASNISDPGRFWAPKVPLEDVPRFPICRPCHSLDGV